MRTRSVYRHAAVQWRRASSQSRREQSRARGEARAQRAVCAGQRQLPCNPGDHSTGQRRQGKVVHTGKHFRMRQRHTSEPGPCVMLRGSAGQKERDDWFDRSGVGGSLLLFAPFWLCRRGIDVMTRGECSHGVPEKVLQSHGKGAREKTEGREEKRRGRASCSFSWKTLLSQGNRNAATREQGQGERACGVQ